MRDLGATSRKGRKSGKWVEMADAERKKHAEGKRSRKGDQNRGEGRETTTVRKDGQRSKASIDKRWNERRDGEKEDIMTNRFGRAIPRSGKGYSLGASYGSSNGWETPQWGMADVEKERL